MNSDTRLRIVRLRLVAPEALPANGAIEVLLGRQKPQIVIGPNGSGKSLLAAVLAAYADHSPLRRERVQELSGAGVHELQIELALGNWIGHGHLNFADGSRSLQWSPVVTSWDHVRGNDASSEHESEQLARQREFELDEITLVQRGRLSGRWPDELLMKIRAQLTHPLDRELHSWTARITALTGMDGRGGRLQEARDHRQQQQSALEHVRTLQQEYESLKSRQQELTLAIADQFANGEMLKAEKAALVQQSRLADRADRLQKWMGELSQSVQSAAELREKAARLEESLAHLDGRFEHAPHNLPELIRTYLALQEQQRELRTQIEILEHDRTLAERTARQYRDELATLTLPPESDFQSLAKHRTDEIRELEDKLEASSRRRSALVRQHEELASQLALACPEFAEVGDGDVVQIVQYLDLLSDQNTRSQRYRIEQTESLRRHEERLAELRNQRQVRFAEFESLPNNTMELLRELSDRRRILATLISDVEQLRKRKDLTVEKAHPAPRIFWAALAALAAFGIGTWAQSWDIGLFLAVLCSGVTLLGFRFAHRGTEQKLDSIVGAQTMSESRLKEVRERIEKLERQLHPLSAIGHLDDALNLYNEYVALQNEYDGLKQNPPAERDATAALEREMKEVGARIPSAIRDLNTEQLRQKLSEFLGIRQRQSDLELQWAAFRDGGAESIKTAALDARRRELNQELADMERRHSELIAEFDARRADVEARLTQLESSAGDSPLLISARLELQAVEGRLKQLGDVTGEFLNLADAETIELEWKARATQRSELAKLQADMQRLPDGDELSARIELLREEFADLTAKLLELDPLYLHDFGADYYAEKYREQQREADRELAANLAAIEAIQQELRTIDPERAGQALAAEPSWEILQGKFDDAQSQVDSIEREVNATRELADAVRQEIAELQRNFATDFQEATGEMLRVLSDNQIVSCAFDHGTLMLQTAQGLKRAAEKHSEGVADLAGIAVRLATLKMLAAIDERPVFWDEPFARLDDRGLARVRTAINELAQQRQVVILTRDPRLAEWGDRFELALETVSGGSVSSMV